MGKINNWFCKRFEQDEKGNVTVGNILERTFTEKNCIIMIVFGILPWLIGILYQKVSDPSYEFTLANATIIPWIIGVMVYCMIAIIYTIYSKIEIINTVIDFIFGVIFNNIFLIIVYFVIPYLIGMIIQLLIYQYSSVPVSYKDLVLIPWIYGLAVYGVFWIILKSFKFVCNIKVAKCPLKEKD